MKLLEYQGKQLFAENGIAVPEGRLAVNALEAEEAARSIGKSVVLKVQVPVGGRGKAGGIKVVDDLQKIQGVAASLLNMNLQGFPVDQLLVEEKVDIAKELYISVVVDTDTGNIFLLFSPAGGMDIEQVAAQNPEKVFRLVVDPLNLPPRYRLRPFIRQGGFQNGLLEELTGITEKLLHLFINKDLLVAEINPLIILEDGRVLAGDAKVEADDNALFRQKFARNFWEERDALEAEARGIGVTYVKLDGSVGVIASGAGLGMATMDLLEASGYKPANFLETGGGITEDLMYKAFHLVCKHENVRSVIINLYGGVNPIEKGAKGIVRALQEMPIPPVVVVKALGNKQEECWDVLKEGGITVVTSVRTEKAVASILELLEKQ